MEVKWVRITVSTEKVGSEGNNGVGDECFGLTEISTGLVVHSGVYVVIQIGG